MISIDNLSPEDLLILTNALAIALAKDKNSDELNVLGNFFIGVGSLLVIISSQQQLLQSIKEKNNAKKNNATNNTTNDNTKNNNLKNNNSKNNK